MSGDNDTTNPEFSGSTGVNVSHYRRLVKQFIDMRRYQSALFWAEKVCVLSENEPRDVYYQAHCMFLLGEYHRAAHLIQYHKLEKTSLPCYNLLLESLYAAKEYNAAAGIIQVAEVEFITTSLLNQPMDASGGYLESPSVFGGEENNRNELLASICLMKGKIFESLDNRGTAMDFYVQALHKSVYCYEALEALVQHEMLLAWEEKELMQQLPLAHQSSEMDAKLILKLYECKLKKYYNEIGEPTNEKETPISNPDTLKYINEIKERVKRHRKSDTYIHKKTGSSFLQPPTPKPTGPSGGTPLTSQVLSPAQKVLEDLKVPAFSLQASLSRACSVIESAQRSYFEASGHRRSRDNNTEQNASTNYVPLNTCLARIHRSTDHMAAEAEKCFYDCDYKRSMKIITDLLKIDPFHNTALTIQIGCLVETHNFNRLFYVAHKLVDRYPDKAISWYAVGCYYDMIGKSDPARRYLSKATTLDKLYGPAWLAYGHSFAKENEHDQAMAAYFKATQLMRGCHLPLLYIGVECGLTKNMELAEKFFFQAMTIAPLDVYVLHELGVIKYEYEYYDSAMTIFRTTADIVQQRARANNEEITVRWEPLYINLGHCCRKLKKYDEAMTHFQAALLLNPQSPSTYTSMGFVQSLMWNLDEAIIFFHKSLALNRDCIVTSSILKTCIEDMMDEPSTIEEICASALAEVARSNAEAMPTSSQPTNLINPDLHLNCLKLKFDEEDEVLNSDMDISFDI